ncbi:MAG: hypothetical protein IPK07_07765, partial [Deltaproteobacteria bacterium]|nr:hypothetical protein [Deltaproteobacteria bacterium]
TAARTGVPLVSGLPRPDALLLNGGVFNGPKVVERLAAVLAAWFPGEPVPLLTHQSLDLAVARGAVTTGWLRGLGVRINGRPGARLLRRCRGRRGPEPRGVRDVARHGGGR